MVDAAVSTDSWLSEAVREEEAGSRQQDAKTDAHFRHRQGTEIVAVLSKYKNG